MLTGAKSKTIRIPEFFFDLDKNISVVDIAIKHDLPFGEVYDYALKFKEEGLIDIIPFKQ